MAGLVLPNEREKAAKWSGKVPQSGPKKSKMISMRITAEQFDYLEEMALRIRKQTGFRVTRASIVLKLMERGLPFLEKEFPAPKKKWWGGEDDEPES